MSDDLTTPAPKEPPAPMETVPLETDEHGHASTIYSYRSLMGHKQAVDLKKMRWAKQDEVPLALTDWVL